MVAIYIEKKSNNYKQYSTNLSFHYFLLVLSGWVLSQLMMLRFEAAVFFAVIIVSYLVQDGRVNYVEGFMLIGTYVHHFPA